MVMDWKTQYCQDGNSHLIDQKINAIAIKIPAGFFCVWGNRQVDFKIYREIQRTWNWQNNFEKEKAGGTFTFLFQTYCDETVIKTETVGMRLDQWKVIESPEILTFLWSSDF